MQLRAILQALRKNRGLSQAQLAQLIGVKQGRVAKIERDPLNLSTKQLIRVLSSLNAELCIQAKETPSDSPPRSTQDGNADANASTNAVIQPPAW